MNLYEQSRSQCYFPTTIREFQIRLPPNQRSSQFHSKKLSRCLVFIDVNAREIFNHEITKPNKSLTLKCVKTCLENYTTYITQLVSQSADRAR